MLQGVAVVHSFLLQNNTPLYDSLHSMKEVGVSI